ncbi:hypothetical protein R3P38DRAFT_2808314 [Favolaschia claudopus]|uniref:Uncharacterized protein n=1 Tax=Favolaschia claudopus TaxID=2862362 RepID=A0AAV9ZHF1_9AGAR
MTRTWTSPYAIKVQRKMLSKELQAMGIPSAQVFIAMANSQTTSLGGGKSGTPLGTPEKRDVFESQDEAYECFYNDESLSCDSDIQTTCDAPIVSEESSRVGPRPVLEHHQELKWAIVSHADLEIAGDNVDMQEWVEL